jgi:hypothetical protein
MGWWFRTKRRVSRDRTNREALECGPSADGLPLSWPSLLAVIAIAAPATASKLAWKKAAASCRTPKLRGWTASANLMLSEVCGFSGGNMGRAADLQKTQVCATGVRYFGGSTFAQNRSPSHRSCGCGNIVPVRTARVEKEVPRI